MNRFKRILVYVNPSVDARPAVSEAHSLARSNGSEVTLMAVIPESPWYSKLVSRGDQRPEDLLLADVRQMLVDLAEPLKREGNIVHTVVETGRPFLELTRTIIERKQDLLVKVAEAEPTIRERLFGSTAMHLVRKAPCPVWLVDPRREERPRRVLAAIDPSPDSEEGRALATKILELASSLADREGAELHLVHAWRVYYEGAYRRYITLEQMLDISKQTRRSAETEVEKVIAPIADRLPRDRLHILPGDPQSVIPNLAQRQGIDLIVMGTVGRTGVKGLLIGNVAETVISQADCAVLAVKPEGFVSPLETAVEASTVRKAA